MTQIRKTPGVYVTELDAFGNSVVPVPTAIPAFIGYTQKTSFNGKDITFQPVKISSFNDFVTIFGDNPVIQFKVTSINSPASVEAMRTLSLAKIGTALTNAKAAQQTATQANAGTAKTAAQTAADSAVTEIAKIQTDANAKLATTADVGTAHTTAGTNITTVNGLISPSGDDVKAVYNLQLAAANAYNDLINEYMGANITKLFAAHDAIATATDKVAAQKTYDDLAASVNAEVKNSDMSVNNFSYTLESASINYRLWSSMKLFYANGGNDCYVITIGSYDTSGAKYLGDTDPFTQAIDLLKLQTEPTMLVIPDAVELNSGIATDTPDKAYGLCYALQEHMLTHCGGDTQDKIAILDIPGGYSEPMVGTKSYEYFRDGVSVTEDKFFSYGAAYYPWLNTVIYEQKDINYSNFTSDSTTVIQSLLNMDTAITQNQKAANYVTALFSSQSTNNITQDQAQAALANISSNYKLLLSIVLDKLNLMPPSAAMAGVYTTVDNNEGVWVAPANKGLQSVLSPSINIAGDMQDDLNVPIDGKSICAIRSFTGRGTLVWGARTLDGNSNDWRYVNIRRTLLYIEQSIKAAAFAYVFAPNVPTTWVDVTAMISNFLTGLWNQGGLVGTKSTDAFSVSVGLGVTMNNDDIQNGYMRVAVKVALSHPAEFIDITFQQQQQA